jgi:choline-glycine betaine transporter
MLVFGAASIVYFVTWIFLIIPALAFKYRYKDYYKFTTALKDVITEKNVWYYMAILYVGFAILVYFTEVLLSYMTI